MPRRRLPDGAIPLRGEQADIRDYDPAFAQAEMETAALAAIKSAEAALAGLSRKDDPDTYDRKRADLRSARDGYRALRTFGPGAL